MGPLFLPHPPPALLEDCGEEEDPPPNHKTCLPRAHPLCLGQRPHTSPSLLPQRPTCHPAALTSWGGCPALELTSSGPLLIAELKEVPRPSCPVWLGKLRLNGGRPWPRSQEEMSQRVETKGAQMQWQEWVSLSPLLFL